MNLEKTRQEAAAALRAYEENERWQAEQEILYAKEAERANLPVERMRKGLVAPEHLRTFNSTTNSPIGLSGASYAVPASSEVFSEMFRGSDIEVRSANQSRSLRLDD